MKLKFFGATRSVSGSMHIVHSEGADWLLDCGLFQGHRRNMYEFNSTLPMPASQIKGVFLSHAHVDHCGKLPFLVKSGFKGKIYATKATVELCSLLLFDSAYILATQIKSLNFSRAKKGLPPLEDIYSNEDVIQTLSQMVAVDWNKSFCPHPNLSVTFLPAGHILGAASIVLRDRSTSLAFTGDLGRKNDWLMKDPVLPKKVDYLIVESTYGNKKHRPFSFVKSQFGQKIAKTIANNGVVVIPAFSLGRSQRIIYELRDLMKNKHIPEVPIYLDSPLSIKASDHFLQSTNELKIDPVELLGPNFLDYIQVIDSCDSKKLIESDGPHIIITASGMCEGGRVLYHLAKNLPKPSSQIIFVGFCAENTLGRLLIENANKVKINGNVIPVKAEINYFDTFSAHADQSEIKTWVKSQDGLKAVFIVHGEEHESFALAEKLESESSTEIIVPHSLEEFELNKSSFNY